MAFFDFYDAGKLRQIAANLFYGWGYNFYRAENQLRSDDQLIRSRSAWLLGLAHASVCKAEEDYRRTYLPPPSRQHPFPDATAVAGAQALERLARDISGLEQWIHAQPVPENDRMTQRFRLEAPTLAQLAAYDEELTGRCEGLRAGLDGQDGSWIVEHHAEIEEGLTAIRHSLTNREFMLHGRTAVPPSPVPWLNRTE